MFLKKVLFLLANRKRKLPFLILLFIFSSFLDVLGVGLIIPYMSFVVNPSILSQNPRFMVFSEFVGNQENILLYMSLILILVFAIKTFSAIFINRKILKFSLDFGVELRSLLMKSYQNLPYNIYTQRNSSEYVYRIQNHTDQVSQQTLQSILRVISEGLITSMLFLFLVITSGGLVFYLIVFLGLIVFAYDRIFQNKIKLMGQKVNESSTRMIRGIYEGMGGFKEIKVLGKQHFFYDKVHENSRVYANVKLQHKIISTMPRFFMELILVSVVVFLVLSFSLSGESTIDALPIISAFAVASLRLMPSISQIIASSIQIRFGKHAVDLLCKDIKSFDKILNNKLKNINNNIFKSFELKNVTYTYPKTIQPAIKNVSIKISNGDTIGIIGSSGSGKTTLIDILLGLLTPNEGDISYNDKPFKDNLNNWTKQVAYLPQQVFLIDDSIERNIALGVEDENIDKIFVDLAVKKSRLSELIKSLPEGISTDIGENGIRLSGGQRQRIALARSFYHNRNILVLDESTSALDQETEREIVDEMKALKGDKTMIVIAHRLNTLQHCDIIYRIEKGEIVSSGSYKDIIDI
jgi:ATP-binding cassette, subfamily B, bacterial PglK